MPPPSQAGATFANSIKDAEVLLEHFGSLPQNLHHRSEVLKRAALVMALTAWETYVEDRVREEVERRWGSPACGNPAGRLLLGKLNEELRGFNTPDAGKTKKLFLDYVGVDVTAGWDVQSQSVEKNAIRLTALVKLRGEAVHRAKGGVPGAPSPPHLVKKPALGKHISFLRELVKATDAALAGPVAEAGMSTHLDVFRDPTAQDAA